MAKFNIEVELDWLNDDTYSIDEEIKEQVIKGVKDELLGKSTDFVIKKLDKEIAEKLEEAVAAIEQRVDDFIETVTEKHIDKIMIPVKSSPWSSEYENIPISEYIGKRFEAFVTNKQYDDNFSIARYDSEKKYSAAEKSIRKYLDDTLSVQVSELVKKAQKDAENTVIKTLEQNLQEQLAVDTIKRMNIPALLESLQNKALEYGGEGVQQ